MRAWGLLAAVFALVTPATLARAYPTSIILAPTGEVMPTGHVAHALSVSMNRQPQATPGSWWFTNQIGLLPHFEVGLDIHNADPFESRHAREQGIETAYLKTLVNAKIQVLVESAWLPSLSIGAIIAPLHPDRSPNAIFASMTKTLTADGAPLGRLTLGASNFYNSDSTVFYGTPPFEDKGTALIGGYESPAVGPLSVAFDYIGGVGEISSTNVALVITPFQEPGTASLLLGGFFGNDLRTPKSRFTGFFAEIYFAWGARAAFAGPR